MIFTERGISCIDNEGIRALDFGAFLPDGLPVPPSGTGDERLG
jgi:hypothetical protein